MKPQFWIDVGGTFTDCLVRFANGQINRLKLLSSGIFKGQVGAGSTRELLEDSSRCCDAPGFWQGFSLRILSESGAELESTTVVQFDAAAGMLQLAPPLQAAPQPGLSYELFSNLPAPLLGAHYLLGLPLGELLPPIDIRLGTTRGTNALLTRSGARTGLATTRGLADVLKIGRQNRPHLFARTIVKPKSLVEFVAEIEEQMSPAGEPLILPQPQQVRQALLHLRRQGTQSLAICLKNAYANSAHEEMVAEIAETLGFEEISISSRVSPLINMVSRGDTTVVDAYLNPVLRSYLRALKTYLPAGSQLRLLTSAGGLIEADQFTGKDSILSGPAGGVVGFSRTAAAAGFSRAIGFDMGGTSTDVSRHDGRFEMQYETEKAGVRIAAPMLAIETVAAGGGSICRFDGVKLVVGPESAGASPGPACYGRGGPLAVTDLNFYLGKLLPDHFPFPLHRIAVEARLDALCGEVQRATGSTYTRESLAEGLLAIANLNMAQAIRSISIAKGYNPRDYILCCFGGAAPQHACAVAEQLEMNKVLIHPDASILSAYGIGLADVVRHAAQSILRPYHSDSPALLRPLFEQLAASATAEVLQEGVAAVDVTVGRSLDLRYRGLDAFLTISEPANGDYLAAYEQEHLRLHGYIHTGRPLEIVAARVSVRGKSNQAVPNSFSMQKKSVPSAEGAASVWISGQYESAEVYLRGNLQPGDHISGPALIVEPRCTTVVDPNWNAEVLSGGELKLARISHALAAPEQFSATAADPVLLELFNRRFESIAEQMGETLRNTAGSVNVKERLDFSCAIFTAAGDLVVNAPHIPVHLGAMGETVKCLLAAFPDLENDDVLITNDPYQGGSHLPDVTVVTPVFHAGQLLFFTASRAHHAEIGGISPGSMPPFSRNLAEEGVLIRPFKVIAGGESHLPELERLLRSGPHPSRNIPDNLADVAAQIAANRRGAGDLLSLIAQQSQRQVLAYMKFIQQAAEQKMRLALASLGDGERKFIDYLDDGSPIVVSFNIQGDAAVLDFTGTGPVLSGNLNANRAIVTAAVIYTLRCLLEEEVPLNQGILAPVKIILPPCLLNPPSHADSAHCAAVAGGNVETSQRIVDVLWGALELAAASQGTMNNFLFGDETFGYYETICGGAGATAAGPGADAVHTHMTNTRLTDPEVLEHRYPVRLLEFSIRTDSGGKGKHSGGNGVVRKIEFLKPLTVSLVTQRRGRYAPYGLAGGEPGKPGENSLQRTNGSAETLPGIAQFSVQPGDVLTIKTPSGGGWGKAD